MTGSTPTRKVAASAGDKPVCRVRTGSPRALSHLPPETADTAPGCSRDRGLSWKPRRPAQAPGPPCGLGGDPMPSLPTGHQGPGRPPQLEGVRYEIIEETCTCRRPSAAHHCACDAWSALRAWSHTGPGCRHECARPDLCPDQDVIPDVIWISGTPRPPSTRPGISPRPPNSLSRSVPAGTITRVG